MEEIRSAIDALLSAAPEGRRGGFVIFHGYHDLDYVQFSLEPGGMLLNWPTVQEGGLERLPHFEEQLPKRGWSRVEAVPDGDPLSEQIGNLQIGQFMVLDDGLYGQAGRDAEANCELTVDLLREVFGVTDLFPDPGHAGTKRLGPSGPGS